MSETATECKIVRMEFRDGEVIKMDYEKARRLRDMLNELFDSKAPPSLPSSA